MAAEYICFRHSHPRRPCRHPRYPQRANAWRTSGHLHGQAHNAPGIRWLLPQQPIRQVIEA